MGKLSYPKFSKLENLAKISVGNSNKIHDLLIIAFINLYTELSEIIKTLDTEIETLYYKTDYLIHTIPGIGVVAAATIYAEIGFFWLVNIDF